MAINEILKELRKERNITQNELADMLSCNRQKIADWERGKSTPSAEDIIVLSKKLNVSSDYLLGLSEAQTNDKDVQFICDYTGLSKNSVDMLHYLQPYWLLPTLNALIESETSSIYKDLGYVSVKKDEENEKDDVVKVDYKDTLEIISAIDNYLEYSIANDDNARITKSGKIIKDDKEIDIDKIETIEDLEIIANVHQHEIVETILINKIVEKIKNLRKVIQSDKKQYNLTMLRVKEKEAGEQNANNSET